MKTLIASVAALIVLGATLAARPATLTGTYVEARTAEVFAGACVVNGEVCTTGREALLAWKVGHGQFNGVSLDGLAIVAAVAADVNLGGYEIGGEPAITRAALFVDARATAVQRDALVAMVKALSDGVVRNVVEVTPAPIEFVESGHAVRVSARTLRLTVEKHLEHDMSCGNKQWFKPLSTVDQAEMGMTVDNAFSGTSLSTKWSDPNKRSGFFGTFSY